MNPETKIEKDACDLIYKHLGVLSSKLKVLGQTGFPDRIFWLPDGKPLLIEFKCPGEEPEPKQRHIHAQLRALGYMVEVHDNDLDALQAVINILVELTPHWHKKKIQVLVVAQEYINKMRKL